MSEIAIFQQLTKRADLSYHVLDFKGRSIFMDGIKCGQEFDWALD